MLYILHLCQISTKSPLENNPLEIDYLWLKSAYCIIHHTLHHLSLKIPCQSKKIHYIDFKGFFKIYATFNKVNYSKEFGKVFFYKVLNDEADLSN